MVASACHRVNRINSIIARGRLWDKKADIESEVVSFYQRLYTGVSSERPRMDGIPVRQLSSSNASSLEANFSKEEIKDAVFGCGGECAPGPDGFPIIFFQNF